MPPPSFDPVVHAPLRLQVCAMLAGCESLDFATVRERLDVSESALSKHVKVLQDAGYVAVRKASSQGRLRTWLALTPTGRRAFIAHAAVLRGLLRDADPPTRTWAAR